MTTQSQTTHFNNKITNTNDVITSLYFEVKSFVFVYSAILKMRSSFEMRF